MLAHFKLTFHFFSTRYSYIYRGYRNGALGWDELKMILYFYWHLGESIQEWTKQKLWNTAFKNFWRDWSISLHSFQRPSSTNFTWFILEYFDSFLPKCIKIQILLMLGKYVSIIKIQHSFLTHKIWEHITIKFT